METFRNISLLLILTILFSCKSEEPQPEVITNPPSSVRGYLVSYAKTGSMTTDDIVTFGKGEGDISNLVNRDLDIYSIVYNSVIHCESLKVSGMVFVPLVDNKDLDIIQNHHGTTLPGDEEIPSKYTGGREGIEMSFVGATFASNGFVVSMPDYVGYGTSADVEHPYTIHHELAEESVDMLLATRQLMEQLGFNFSGKIFLTGWSEGGGAGLATHRLIQEDYTEDFQIVASSLLAGPYDYFGFIQDILISRRNVSDINLTIYSWAVYALNKAGLKQNANTIWRHKVGNQIDAIEIPSYKAGEVFHDSFMDGLVNETDQEWVSATKQNSLVSGWVPQGQVYLHSGTDDYIVPHYNSVNAHQYFTSVNARSTLYEYERGDHYTPLYKYITTTLDDFNGLK